MPNQPKADTVSYLLRIISPQDDSKEPPEFHDVPFSLVGAHERFRQQIIDNALKELRSWQKRYQQYSELTRPTMLVGKILEEFPN